MCTLNDIEGNCEDLLVTEKSSQLINSNCRSCPNKGLVVLRKKDIYCKACFLATETHKFRAALGKSKIIKPDDTVLVAYSGSQSSVALLHLLHSGVTEEQHKKLIFNVIFLFIDEGALFNLKIDERKEVVKKIKNQVSAYNFSLFVTSLSDCLKGSPTVDTSLIVNEECDKNLINLFNSLKNFTSKEDLLNGLKKQLILKAAEQLKCNKVFTAEVGSNIAIKLLSSFSLGKGATGSYGFCDSSHPMIKILRPLRDFTSKEIIFYNRFHSLDADNTLTFTTKSPFNISIQKLTEKFVTDLQEEFPSTVYTIFRTAEKISVNTADDENKQSFCVMCYDKIKITQSRNDYTAVEAANFSRNVSRKIPESSAKKPGGTCCGSCSERYTMDIDSLELDKFLCYSCRLIVRDMKSVEALPKHILQMAEKEKIFKTMKEEISDFLIKNSVEEEEESLHS